MTLLLKIFAFFRGRNVRLSMSFFVRRLHPMPTLIGCFLFKGRYCGLGANSETAWALFGPTKLAVLGDYNTEHVSGVQKHSELNTFMQRRGLLTSQKLETIVECHTSWWVPQRPDTVLLTLRCTNYLRN